MGVKFRLWTKFTTRNLFRMLEWCERERERERCNTTIKGSNMRYRYTNTTLLSSQDTNAEKPFHHHFITLAYPDSTCFRPPDPFHSPSIPAGSPPYDSPLFTTPITFAACTACILLCQPGAG